MMLIQKQAMLSGGTLMPRKEVLMATSIAGDNYSAVETVTERTLQRNVHPAR